MGRKIYDEDLRLNLILNGEPLNNGSRQMVAALGHMEREMVNLEQHAKSLAASIKHLETNSKANAVQLQQEKLEYAQTVLAIKAKQKAIEDMRIKIGLAGMTVQQLRNHLKALQTQLYNTAADIQMQRQLQAEIRETQIMLTTATTGASRFAQAWLRLERAVNRAGTIVGWTAMAIFGLFRLFDGVITRMKDLEDLIGNVRKNTNLTTAEVWEMKDAFDHLDTRTSTDDLLKLAVVAGKLGIEGKVNIMKFVDSANKIQIALGDDLQGSVEDTVNSIGKLMNAFRIDKEMPIDQAMMRTGDVLNELAKSSAAGAGTILEYTTRLSAVAELSGFTIDQIAAMGSVLDALHVPSERGATALQKIMLQLANPKKIGDFAEALGLVSDATGTMSEKYIELLKNDPNKVLNNLLTKFVSTKNGLVDLTEGLKQFGVRGQYMTAVLGSLALNLDVLKQQQEISYNAWKDNISIMNEYDIMNNNFTAEILKQGKIRKTATDQMNRDSEGMALTFSKVWTSIVVGFKDVTYWIGSQWTAIKILTAAYVLLKAPMIYHLVAMGLERTASMYATAQFKIEIYWRQLQCLWTRNLNTYQLQLVANSQILNIAHLILTGQFQKATVAIKAYALAANSAKVALGAMAITVAIVAAAIYFLVLRKRELTDAEKLDLELRSKINKSFFEEKGNLDTMIDRLKDKNIADKERKEIIAKIVEQYGDYLPLLKKEGITADEVTGSYNKLIEAMGRKILRTNLMETAGKNNASMLEAKANVDDITAKIAVLKEKLSKTGKFEVGIFGPGETQSKIDKLERNLAAATKAYKVFFDQQQKYSNELAKLDPPKLLPVSEDDLKVALKAEKEAYATLSKQIDADRKAIELKTKITGKMGYNPMAENNALQANVLNLQKIGNEIDKNERKLKSIVDAKELDKIMEQTEAPFKARQEQRKADLLLLETEKTEEAANKKKGEEWLQKELRKIRLNYLNLEISDMEKSGRIYDADEKAWLEARTERAKLMIDPDGKKGGGGINKEAQKEIEKNAEKYALKQRDLANKYAKGEIGDKEDYEERKIQIETEKDDELLKILTKYHLKRSDIINDQAENEVAMMSKAAANEIDDNNSKAALKRQEAADKYANGEIVGKENIKGVLLQIEKERLAEEFNILTKYNESRAATIKKQADLEVKIKDNTSTKEKELGAKIIKDAEDWYKEEKRCLDEQYVNDATTRDTYNQRILDAELTMDYFILEARKKLSLDLTEINQKISEDLKKKLDQGVTDAKANGKELDKTYGSREKGYIIKMIESAKTIKEINKNKTLDDKEKAAQSDAIHDKMEEWSAKEEELWAQSSMAAVENADTIQGATVGVLNSIRARISAYLSEAIAAQIVKAIGKVPFPLNLIVASVAAAGVMALFNTIIPKFEVNSSGGVGMKTMSWKRKTKQAAEGIYPVIGLDDGKMYGATYGGQPQTGVYDRPTLLNMSKGRTLVGEKAPELVVDGATFRRMQINAPQMLQNIYQFAGKTQQRANGYYPEQSPGANQSRPRTGRGDDHADAGLARLEAAVSKLNAHLDKGINANINKYGYNGLKQAIDDIANFNSKIGK
jgi:TP901 family phage tail tape measure protein